MIEKLKTGLLTFLVLLSILLSYMLAYSYPKYDPVVPDEYIKTDTLGRQIPLPDMLFPDQLVLHLGNDRHTLLYANLEQPQYREIINIVNQRYMQNFHKTTLGALGLNWDEVRSKRPGLEVRFRDGLPLDVLQEVMQIKGELPAEGDLITRIWVFVQENNEVRTILFTDTASTLYEAEANFSVKDVEKFVKVEEGYPPYRYMPQDYYLPEGNLTVSSPTMNYTQLTEDQLKRTFFVDPALTRSLTEWDGSDIYMDGTRGLQMRGEQRWLTYSDPVAPSVDNKEDLKGNLRSAVQFINQHGGWNGTYGLQKVPQQLLPSSGAYVFRQYYDGYPVIGKRGENIGFVKIVVQKGIVSSYERSTMMPDVRSAVRRDVILPGGEALDAKLKQYGRIAQVYSVFPAYRPVVTERTLELIPGWAAELRDGSYEFID
ncbi:YycH family regulatory protein [Paenibacillus caseinilyticus]|uniref:Regulatory protein YycH domain-containing protein n=1 Tax=Paenibacillus mucilaginosus K02 TaxID=997761 RepID=I0BVF2_9BACL|nr:two-component system activity regulator YycH [Paenibacillus mucilaginosus]AFH66349.1 hypothetical protein B2K_37590 [Paenibacillus mucilaginosus K02]